MTLLNIRFCWGNPPVVGGRWHAGLVNLKRVPTAKKDGRPVIQDSDHPMWREYRKHQFHLSLRGVLIWKTVVLVVAYFAGAFALLKYLEQKNSYNRVGYVDLILPSRWQNLDRLRGEGLIAKGDALVEAGRFSDGFHLLRAGLARHPADHVTRLKIAKIYARMRLRTQVEQLLRVGFDHGYPGRDYVEFALLLAKDAERHDERVRLCELASARLAALEPALRPVLDQRWLDRQTVDALIAAGRAPEAVALVERAYRENDSFRRETVLRHLLETGRAAEAVALARLWAGEAPREEMPWKLLIHACRLAGDHAGMDSALARLRALTPASPDPLIVAVTEKHLAGRTADARAALDELLFRHGARADLYFRLSTVLGNLDYAAGLDRIEAESRERGFSRRPMLWARFQQASNRRDWPAVLAYADEIASAPGPAFPPAQVHFQDMVARLARACLDASSGIQAGLVEIVADRPGPLSYYKMLLESLLEARRITTAHRVLTLAEGAYANSEAIVALRVRIETGIAESAAADAVRSEATAGAEVRVSFASAEAAKAEIARLIAAGDPAGALAVIVAARRARPDWLSSAEAGLERQELRLRVRDEDPLRLQLLVRSVLPRSADAASSLLGLARVIHVEGHVENAILITREVLRHDPANADALGLLELWQPRVELVPPESSP